MGSDNNDDTFDEELQIDMKGPVGDAVGNVSPTHCELHPIAHYFVDEHQPDKPRHRSCRVSRATVDDAHLLKPKLKSSGPLHNRLGRASGSSEVSSTRRNLGCGRRTMEPASVPCKLHHIYVQ